MKVEEAVAQLDEDLFAHAGRPPHYPEARPREHAEQGLCVVDGGPPQGLGPHPLVVLHYDQAREVHWVGVALEGAGYEGPGFEGEARVADLDEAVALCWQILTAHRARPREFRPPGCSTRVS